MNLSFLRTSCGAICALLMLSLVSPVSAQQGGPAATTRSVAAPSDPAATPSTNAEPAAQVSTTVPSVAMGPSGGAANATDASPLAEAQLALGANSSVLSSLLAAAMREARLSAGISSDAGIKERAASRFAELVRAEARRIRLGMGLLATIGATSPFVGLFGTVWGIMNSFIGISKAQTTNLAVVAPGIAEALLATAIGLVAAIPAVIIYNHFARLTKSYLELVSRASGASARLLSRDLDRSHGSVHSRAAE